MSFRSVKRPKRTYRRFLWPWKSRENFMFLSFIHIWNILHLQQLKGLQSLNRGMWRASPYKTLLSTPTSPPGPPHPRRPNGSQLDREPPRIAQCIIVLSNFILSDYLSVFHCVMGLRLNLSLAEIWQKCCFLSSSYFAEKLALLWGWKGSWERWQSTNWSCAVLSLWAITVREFPSFKQNAGLFRKRSKEN